MRLVILFLLVLCARSVWAEDVTRMVDSSDTCPEAAPEGSSASDNYAWQRICRGQWANMSFATGADDGADCDALSEEDWPKERRLSARFIKTITTRAPYTEVTASRRVMICCAEVPERLVLAFEHLPQTLWLNDNRLPGGASFRDARIEGDLALSGSRIESDLNLEGLILDGDLFLANGVFPQTTLRGAQVGGVLSAIGSRFTGKFNADGLSVDGSLFLRGGAEFAEVDLLGVQVGRNLDAIGSRFTGKFNADSLTVGGSLFLRGGAEFAEVDLIGAQVGGVLSVFGSRFTCEFNANRLSVGRSLLLREGATFADVVLVAAQVGGHIQIQDSTFNGRVDLTETTSQALMLWRSAEGGVPTWGPEAKLVLRNAQTGSLQFKMPDSWLRADGTAVPVDPVGFRYERLGGLGSGDGYDVAQIDRSFVDAIVNGPFVSAQGAGFIPQPYMQLEQVLRDSGAERAANRVALARQRERLRWYWQDGQYARWALNTVHFALTGFGTRPFWVLGWFAALVALGTWIARRATGFAGKHWTAAFWYSLENATPLMSPATDHEGVTFGSP